MTGSALLYVGSILIALWGIAHIIPTRSVVAGFGPLPADNRRILTMEWVAEGLALAFIGVLVLLVVALGGQRSAASVVVYRACAAMLLLMAGWTLLTGARTAVVFFKICPLVKTAGAVLFVLGSVP